MSPSRRSRGTPGVQAFRRSGVQADEPVLITRRLLRDWPLPQPDEEGDKEERGRVLVVGGSREMPGAIILAAVAALRAGAGKLRIAAGQSIALLVAAAIPEARVFALPETAEGAIDPAAAEVAEYANQVQAVLIGPGMTDEGAVAGLTRSVLPHIERAVVILDAAALAGVAEATRSLHALEGRAVVTPHAGEMAGMLGLDRAAVTRDPLATARRASKDLQAVVALKGAETVVAAPDGAAYCNRTGNVGLATSGSGDTLAGIVAGLAARGAAPLQATVWGVYLHGRAGDKLANRMGRLGFLARELLDEVPALMADFDGRRRGR